MRALLLVLVTLVPVEAAMLCARPKSDATLNAGVKVREACKSNEVRLGIVSLTPLEVADQATVTTTTSSSTSSSTTTSSAPGSSTTTTTLANRWIDNADGTVSDIQTGLMWEKLSDDGSIHDKDAVYVYNGPVQEKIALLNATAFAGYADWRLSSRLELESILDLTIAPPGPTVPAAFNQGCTFACTVLTCSCTATGQSYWTSNLYVGNPQYAWAVYFNDGSVFNVDKRNPLFARAVRGGPPL